MLGEHHENAARRLLASALLGFWQMMNAAVGVWMAAAVSHDAMFALGIVLTIFSLP